MSKLEFNIESVPPTKEDLDKWRQEAADRVNRLCQWWGRLGSVIVMLAVFFVSCWLAFWLVSLTFYFIRLTENTISLSSAVFLVVLGLSSLWLAMYVVVMVKGWVDNPLDRALEVLAQLNLITPENNPELIVKLSRWCEENDTIKNYVTAVKNQGRLLVKGEYEEIELVSGVYFSIKLKSDVQQKAEFFWKEL